MGQREKIQASIDYLNTIQDNIMIKNEQKSNPNYNYESEILTWLVDKLTESLLLLDTISKEH